MQSFQHNFLSFIIQENALKFGEFTLKSGRKSPYFFNIGHLYTGEALLQLGRFYADALQFHGCEFDVLFGPAYKGIPLSVATAMQLAQHHKKNIPYSFNRKEVKAHGEGGLVVGSSLKDKACCIIDDVITAGTAKKEAIDFIKNHEGKTNSILIALDRQEKAENESLSSAQLFTQHYKIPILSIITFTDIIDFLKPLAEYQEIVEKMLQYQEQFGI